MTHSHRRPSLLLAFALLVLSASAATAQSVPTACRDVVAATKKQMLTPHHLYVTITSQALGGKPALKETIVTSDAIYVKIKDTWKRVPTTPQERAADIGSDMDEDSHTTCRKVRDESVSGVPASVWEVHEKNENSTSSGFVWVGKGTGLPLRTETDVDVGSSMGKSHNSSRVDYSNVHAPVLRQD